MDTVFVLHPHRATIERAIAEVSTDRRIVILTAPHELARRISEIEALVVSLPPRGIWAGATSLRLLHLAGVGAEGLLPAPDLPAQVRIACARGLFAAEAAEHVITMMLALVRRLPELVAQQQRREWRRREVDSVAGKTLAILGLGAIGRRVARAARALDMRVIATRLTPAPEDPDVDEVLGPEHTLDLLARADVVVVALPSTPKTRGLLDARALAMCRPHTLLVNAARGGIVDENALQGALEQGALAGAALDVFEHEPLAPTSALWAADNVLITPHAAGFGRDYAARLLGLALDNLARLESGTPLIGEVDRDRGY